MKNPLFSLLDVDIALFERADGMDRQRPGDRQTALLERDDFECLVRDG